MTCLAGLVAQQACLTEREQCSHQPCRDSCPASLPCCGINTLLMPSEREAKVSHAFQLGSLTPTKFPSLPLKMVMMRSHPSCNQEYLLMGPHFEHSAASYCSLPICTSKKGLRCLQRKLSTGSSPSVSVPHLMSEQMPSSMETKSKLSAIT